jgi:hypothetical protein
VQARRGGCGCVGRVASPVTAPPPVRPKHAPPARVGAHARLCACFGPAGGRRQAYNEPESRRDGVIGGKEAQGPAARQSTISFSRRPAAPGEIEPFRTHLEIDVQHRVDTPSKAAGSS